MNRQKDEKSCGNIFTVSRVNHARCPGFCELLQTSLSGVNIYLGSCKVCLHAPMCSRTTPGTEQSCKRRTMNISQNALDQRWVKCRSFAPGHCVCFKSMLGTITILDFSFNAAEGEHR